MLFSFQKSSHCQQVKKKSCSSTVSICFSDNKVEKLRGKFFTSDHHQLLEPGETVSERERPGSLGTAVDKILKCPNS